MRPLLILSLIGLAACASEPLTAEQQQIIWQGIEAQGQMMPKVQPPTHSGTFYKPLP